MTTTGALAMITGIQQNMQASFPVGPTAPSFVNDRAAAAPKEMHLNADVVTVQAPTLMSDEEASSAIMQIENSLQENSTNGLSIHDGLDASRVFSLLEGL